MIPLPNLTYNDAMNKITKSKRSEMKEYTRGGKRYAKRQVKRTERQLGKQEWNKIQIEGLQVNTLMW